MNIQSINILAIDTATERFSVALSLNTEDARKSKSDTPCSSVVNSYLFEADAGLRHSELIMGAIDALTEKAGLSPGDIGGVVVTGGPGSFTGLRIGFSAAKGLCLAIGAPLAAIPTLDCMAWPFSAWPGLIVPVIDAKKGAFFCALYKDGEKLCPDRDATPGEIARELRKINHGVTRSFKKRSCSSSVKLRALRGKKNDQILLVGPGAQMLHQKLAELNCDCIRQIQAEKKMPWGGAAALLRIAQEKNIFAGNNCDYSAGPQYIRKSDAELQLSRGST